MCIRKIILSMTGLFLFSCSYKVDKEIEKPIKFDGANLSFSDVRALALGPKCARCHDWVASYAETKALASEISDRVQGLGPKRSMPPVSASQLSANEKAAIVAWIAAGAQERPGEVEQPPPELPPTEPPADPTPRLNFELVKSKVFTAKCIRCHQGELDSFEAAAHLIQEIEFRIQDIGGDGQMPPPNRPQLTDEEKNLVLEWIRSGAPKD